MNPDGTPLLSYPSEEIVLPEEEHKMYSQEDLENALAKKKKENDASLEALVQLRIATMVLNAIPIGETNGMPSVANVSNPPSVQQPPTNANSTVPWLYPKTKYEKPKYNFGGTPPLLDETVDIPLWRVGMQDFLRFICDEMLDIVEFGFKAIDPKNLTPSEAYDKHLNDSALMVIRRGMSDKQRRPYIHITTAKELWDSIVMTRTGTSAL